MADRGRERVRERGESGSTASMTHRSDLRERMRLCVCVCVCVQVKSHLCNCTLCKLFASVLICEGARKAIRSRQPANHLQIIKTHPAIFNFDGTFAFFFPRLVILSSVYSYQK